MPFVPVSLTQVVGIDQGIITTIVNGATTTGTGFSQQWGVPASSAGINARTAQYVARGTFSVCTATLRVSNDGGTTFQVAAAAIDLAANPAGVLQNLVTGCIYRLDVTTFTGTSIFVDLALA